MTLRDVLHLAEERAALMRAIDRDSARDEDMYHLAEEADALSHKIAKAIEELPLAQRQQLFALCDPLYYAANNNNCY